MVSIKTKLNEILMEVGFLRRSMLKVRNLCCILKVIVEDWHITEREPAMTNL